MKSAIRLLAGVALALAACAGPSAPRPATAPASSTGAEAVRPRLVPPLLPKSPSLRLPAAVRPTHYALDLTLVPSRDTFRGTVAIDLELAEPTSVVWLNSVDLTVTKARIEAAGATLGARPMEGDPGFLGFVLERPVGPGKARLTVEYEGAFDKVRSRGLYAVAEGAEWYAYTMFEPIDARRAFPCFDEPGFKVPWQLTLHVKKEHVARANAPIASETVEGDMKAVRFADSKPMPSYLVAFVVGPFDLVDAGSVGRQGVPLRFIVPHGRGAETRYAAQVTPRIISLLEGYFGMDYPYEKLDVAVVPRFWGTMEHPGIVALGQPLTLIKSGRESLDRQQSYANIAIHELAHYWFGDYVTMAWWDDTWLNEALATWLDTKLTDQLEPSWGWRLMRRGSTESAIHGDSLVTAKRLRQPVESRHDIEGSFDNEITYFKGAAVLTMFESWVGPAKFQAFIRRYMAQNAWKNATTGDFLAALAAETSPEVAAAFATFVDQPGLPQVTATVQCEPGAPPKVALAQQRYLPAGSKGSATGELWRVPVCVRYGAGAQVGQTCALLSAPSAEVPLDVKSCPDWLLPNAGGNGYYRSTYDGAQLNRLLRHEDALTLPERSSLLSDVGAAANQGTLPLDDALALVPALSHTQDRFVMRGLFGLLGVLRRDTLSPEQRVRYERFLRKTFGERAKALGWQPRPGEDANARNLRQMMLGIAAGSGDDPALASQARKLAEAWLVDRKAVDPDVLGTVLDVAARHGDRALFDRFLAEARKTQDREERSDLFFALGSFREPSLARAALELLRSGEFDLRDVNPVLMRALGSMDNRELAWEFLRENFDALSPKMRDDGVDGLLRTLGKLFCDEAHREQVAEFFTPRAQKFDGAPRVLAHSLEEIDLCAAAQKRNAASVARFLERY